MRGSSSSQLYMGYTIEEIQRKMERFTRDLEETDRRLRKLEKSLHVIRKDRRPRTVQDEIDKLLRDIGPRIFD